MCFGKFWKWEPFSQNWKVTTIWQLLSFLGKFCSKKKFSLPSWSGFWFDFEAAHCTNQPSNKYDKIRKEVFTKPTKKGKLNFSRRFHIYFQQILVWETWKLRHMSSFYSRCQIAQVFLHLAEWDPKIFLLHLTVILKYFTYIYCECNHKLFPLHLTIILKYFTYMTECIPKISILNICFQDPQDQLPCGTQKGWENIWFGGMDPFNGLKLEESLKLCWLNISSATAQERADTNLWRSKSCEKVRVITQNDLKKKKICFGQSTKICKIRLFS